MEFRLGVREDPQFPDPETEQWCRAVDRQLTDSPPAAASGPSLDCAVAATDSLESLICSDVGLTTLDRQLAEVYARAARLAIDAEQDLLRAEQIGWIVGRDDCWSAENPHACLQSEYQRRIAELQAGFGLVTSIGPVTYVCGGNAANRMEVSYFETEPATLIVERGDNLALMFWQPSASGNSYQGRNSSFWEHQGEALLIWGYQQPTLQCQRLRGRAG